MFKPCQSQFSSLSLALLLAGHQKNAKEKGGFQVHEKERNQGEGLHQKRLKQRKEAQ
jgi:hypothetical protein